MKFSKLVILALFTVSFSAHARKSFTKTYSEAYPKAKFKMECNSCHVEDSEEDALTILGTDAEQFVAEKKINWAAFQERDSDGDGVNNFNEFMKGTNPNDPGNKSNSILDMLTDEEVEEVAMYYNNL